MPAPAAAEIALMLDADPGDAKFIRAYDAEVLAQGRVCNVTKYAAEPYPDDLTEALARRVAYNMATAELPLGMQPSLTPGAGAAPVGGNDPEIRRLESGFRRLTFG